MEDINPVIYGLESQVTILNIIQISFYFINLFVLQARALAPQLAESNEIRFFIATQSLKPNNQLHLVELNEDATSTRATIFTHPAGEVWKLNSSPYDTRSLVSCYSTQKGNQVRVE